MKKFLVAALLLGFFLILPLASAGSIYFKTYHHTDKGSIIQEYISLGDSGKVTYRSSYTNGELIVEEINAVGSDWFNTSLDPTPSHSWTANVNFFNRYHA